MRMIGPFWGGLKLHYNFRPILSTDLLFESVEADAALEYFTHLADRAVRVSGTENFLDVCGDIPLNILWIISF